MSQDRIVNLAFVAAALLLCFLGVHLFANLFDLFRPEWDAGIIGREFRLSNLLGISLGALTGVALWRNPTIFLLAHEITGELRKVTWPSGAETRLSTVVVIITTILVSVCLWAFDTVFSALTRLIYRI